MSKLKVFSESKIVWLIVMSVSYFSLLFLLIGCANQGNAAATSTDIPVMPTPSSIANSSGLPTDIAQSLDREACPKYCWRGLMLGQTREEALSVIRSDPWTDKSLGGTRVNRFGWEYEFPNDDYVHIKGNELNGSIVWFVMRPDGETSMEASISIKQTRVVDIFAPVVSQIPFSTIVEQIGYPDYVFVLFDPPRYVVFYEDGQLAFQLEGIGGKAQIRPQNQIQVLMYSEDTYQLRCDSTVQPWRGYGGGGKYFEPNDLMPPTREVPEDCP